MTADDSVEMWAGWKVLRLVVSMVSEMAAKSAVAKEKSTVV